MASRILATGSYLPARVVTNREMEGWMETSEAWIEQRSGIRARHFAADSEATSDLGLVAAQRCLAGAELAPATIDLILFATSTADYLVPGAACFLQHKLGTRPVGAIDVRGQCSGFLYALALADVYVRAGEAERVLVVGAEVQSAGLDLSTAGRDTAVLFGDGGGAVVVGPSAGLDHAILATTLGADGAFADALSIPAPGTARRPFLDSAQVAAGLHRIHMDGRLVFKQAVVQMPAALRVACDRAGVAVADLDWVVPHQANQRILDATAGALGLCHERVISTVATTGNTTAASIPIALDTAVRDGRIQPGQLVGLVAFGAGFTWAAAVVRW
ncbi:MAG: 3-oxoacyl-ACP synthase [Nitrospirae bacterium CG18_big_fil_WC_8_21_14_2_50_70_55]|nr:ketoacyl-ACP synthase III [Deltaproteobacteria bacterium]OIP65909.1 MAG: hypothetical protein AUK30_03660 [Nitrospirae bacterium CG2_30_70_394]PIQ04643.1 MAG: 3-oxoacyl-ACP synthase [Nitrospirae bacterium CG18_big_fil_WC_8_21_14_2_50_70_55]PIU79916.1 MAG: 3-oxoacyl-ACP synthase [Nitrospirae bacterium CG06_land_8_20_14_3_00_70_43]PIW82890.1 MAG: 3-oxoacyl-ACP synthase [Nitrospirae bacterium CG_4_8_14_3_um_filter_70_85]PIX83196.1 MAG: 3-oxoacyl-ACP synthase [Nitrospirae bacterium CG_4_10_14_3